MSDATPFFHDETMLMSWGESDTQGPWIKLRLPSSEALAPFRGMTKAKGDKAGQRIACAMVEIGDDEKPVEQPDTKGGPLARLAGMWCGDEGFQQWTFLVFKPEMDEIVASMTTNGDYDQVAAAIVRHVCEIESRTELDHDPMARGRFDLLIRQPYSQYLKENGHG